MKHLCKICRKGVNGKTGLQCQGACKCWIHYSCLEYPSGKIKEIKAGNIKIACPCPDCKSTNCNTQKCKIIPRYFKEKSLSTKEDDEAFIEGRKSLRPTQSWNSASKKSVQTSALAINRLGNQYIGYSNFPTFPQNLSVRYDGQSSASKSEPTLIAVEKMCITIGELTCQLNNMIQKMKETAFFSSACPGLNMVSPSIQQPQYKTAGTTPVFRQWH